MIYYNKKIYIYTQTIYMYTYTHTCTQHLSFTLWCRTHKVTVLQSSSSRLIVRKRCMLTPFSISNLTKSTLSITSASSIACSRELTYKDKDAVMTFCSKALQQTKRKKTKNVTTLQNHTQTLNINKYYPYSPSRRKPGFPKF